jgi:glycosyltransferase involved in cell wall biosynthesis
VTIVVPVRNGGAFLRESLDSILGQTYPSLEVVVMDDDSDDETGDILAEYVERGVTVVRQAEARGIYANANDGIERARGEFVAVFHADDVYEPDLVERQVDFLQSHPTTGAVFASDIFIDATGREFGRLRLPREVVGSRPLAYGEVVNALLTHKNAFLRCPSALVRASVYADVGLYDQEEFKNTSDLEMWFRIARKYELAVLDEHLFRYRRGHGSSSERYHTLRTDEERFFTIVDRELRLGASGVASAAALRAYETHRAADVAVRAAALYIKGDLAAARDLLGRVRTARLRTPSGRLHVRLALLVLLLRGAVRLPRSAALARRFQRRWHSSSTRSASR